VTTTALKKGNGHGKKCTPNFDHRVLDTKTEIMQEAEAIQEAEEEAVELAEEAELEEKDLAEPSPNHKTTTTISLSLAGARTNVCSLSDARDTGRRKRGSKK
jgi:hypothetical protein